MKLTISCQNIRFFHALRRYLNHTLEKEQIDANWYKLGEPQKVFYNPELKDPDIFVVQVFHTHELNNPQGFMDMRNLAQATDDTICCLLLFNKPIPPEFHDEGPFWLSLPSPQERLVNKILKVKNSVYTGLSDFKRLSQKWDNLSQDTH